MGKIEEKIKWNAKKKKKKVKHKKQNILILEIPPQKIQAIEKDENIEKY